MKPLLIFRSFLFNFLNSMLHSYFQIKYRHGHCNNLLIFFIFQVKKRALQYLQSVTELMTET